MKLVDDRVAPRSSSMRYRPAWGFKRPVRDIVRSWINEHCESPVIHLCSGASNIGDVQIDLYHPSADVRGDARALPVDDVPTILCDPPWSLKSWCMKTRMKVVAEVVDAIHPGGHLIWYAPWVPAANLLTLEETQVRELGHVSKPITPPLLTRWRRER
jgi:hypothetical protein